MYAISKAEQYQVIGFNSDGTQMMLCFAATLEKLLTVYMAKVVHMEASGANNILPSFQKITVWNVEQGFTGFDLPYIATM